MFERGNVGTFKCKTGVEMTDEAAYELCKTEFGIVSEAPERFPAGYWQACYVYHTYAREHGLTAYQMLELGAVVRGGEVVLTEARKAPELVCPECAAVGDVVDFMPEGLRKAFIVVG